MLGLMAPLPQPVGQRSGELRVNQETHNFKRSLKWYD